MENFYAQTWEQDRLSKAHREEVETQQQFERNHSTLEVRFFIFSFDTLVLLTQKLSMVSMYRINPTCYK